jgi:ubiquinone/menaquinone biosynthesis C-methylase UbiE
MAVNNKDESLKFTGERLVTSVTQYWALEHLHRYALAADLTKGKEVVDVASGEGYGSNLLAEHATSVVGIDISEEAIEHANLKYKKSNLKFMTGSAIEMGLPDSSVDVVVSFETIEHLPEHEKMLLEIKRVLKEDGILVISTPDKRVYSDNKEHKNPFHVKELYTTEFENLIQRYFPHTLMMFQKTAVASIISTNVTNKKSFHEFNGDYETVSKHEFVKDAVYNICIASGKELPVEVPKYDSFFFNEKLNDFYFGLYQQYRKLETENNILSQQVKSWAYRLGRILTFPVRFIKNKYNSI